MSLFIWVLSGPAFKTALLQAQVESKDETPIYTYNIVEQHPHAEDAYTQGLLVDASSGDLFESTGLRGQSSLRRVDLETGFLIRNKALSAELFGEGLALAGNTLYQLTLTAGKAFVYDKSTLALTDTLTYTGEGWGLTYDGEHLIMSNGSSTLTYLRPEDFSTVRKLNVTDRGNAITQLNELEFINGKIYANIWKSDLVAIISTTTGEVEAYIDFSGLRDFEKNPDIDDVLNGIAYDEIRRKLYVTGKRWDTLFEVEILKATTTVNQRGGEIAGAPLSGGSSSTVSDGSGGCFLRMATAD